MQPAINQCVPEKLPLRSPTLVAGTEMETLAKSLNHKVVVLFKILPMRSHMPFTAS